MTGAPSKTRAVATVRLTLAPRSPCFTWNPAAPWS